MSDPWDEQIGPEIEDWVEIENFKPVQKSRVGKRTFVGPSAHSEALDFAAPRLRPPMEMPVMAGGWLPQHKVPTTLGLGLPMPGAAVPRKAAPAPPTPQEGDNIQGNGGYGDWRDFWNGPLPTMPKTAPVPGAGSVQFGSRSGGNLHQAYGIAGGPTDREQRENAALLAKRQRARAQAEMLTKREQEQNPLAERDQTGGGQLMRLLGSSVARGQAGMDEARVRQVVADFAGLAEKEILAEEQKKAEDARQIELQKAQIKTAQAKANEPGWEERRRISNEDARTLVAENRKYEEGREAEQRRLRLEEEGQKEAAARRKDEERKRERDAEETRKLIAKIYDESAAALGMAEEIEGVLEKHPQLAGDVRMTQAGIRLMGQLRQAREALERETPPAEQVRIQGRVQQLRETEARLTDRMKAASAEAAKPKPAETPEPRRARLLTPKEQVEMEGRLQERARAVAKAMKTARSGTFSDDPSQPLERALTKYAMGSTDFTPDEAQAFRKWYRQQAGVDVSPETPTADMSFDEVEQALERLDDARLSE